MTFWAYGIATVGFCSGMCLMFLLKKWKIGAWLTCVSLAVFAGASINIHNLVSVDDAFKYEIKQQMSTLSNDVAGLNVRMVQSMVLTQQIVQTVNLVTEVKKEVADIREMITGLYDRTRTETVRPGESNRLWYVEKKDGAHVTVLRLEQAFLRQSVSVVAFGKGQQIPILPTSLTSYRNILTIPWDSAAPSYTAMSYIVTYTLDPNNTNLYDRIAIQEDSLLLDEQLRVTFP